MRIIPKEIETLWTLFTAPVIWAFHFLFCYVAAAVWCAKRGDTGFGILQAGIALQKSGLIKADVDVKKALDDLVADNYVPVTN